MALAHLPSKCGTSNPNWRGGAPSKCDQCRLPIWVGPSRLKKNKHHFCDRLCRNLWLAENTKGTAGSNWKGGPVRLNCRECGREFEVSRAERARRNSSFCSRGCREAGNRGENSPLWKGGAREQGRRHYQKHKTDPIFRTRRRVSKAIRRAIRAGKGGKSLRELLGYSLAELVARLAETMPENATWDDFHAGRLHIDHKKPMVLFNIQAAGDDEFRACWALSNLQLLWNIDNWRKNRRYEEP